MPISVLIVGSYYDMKEAVSFKGFLCTRKRQAYTSYRLPGSFQGFNETTWKEELGFSQIEEHWKSIRRWTI
jgi:hypothetical protein